MNGSIVAGTFGKIFGVLKKRGGERLAQPVADYLNREFGTLPTAARRKGEENAAAFLELMVQRIATSIPPGDKGERQLDERLERALTDPAAAWRLLTCTASAARTPSRDRHEMLAQLVVERLGAEADSAKSVACDMALDAIERLGGEHLQLLGVLAAIHATPTQRERYDIARALADEWRQAPSAEPSARLAPAIGAAIAKIGVPESVTDASLVHLSAVGCVYLGARDKRFLEDVLLTLPSSEQRDRDFMKAYMHEREALGHLVAPNGAVPLTSLWFNRLSSIVPTPAGLVLGLSVHDLKVGTKSLERFEWSGEDAPIHFTAPDEVIDMVGTMEFKRAAADVVREQAQSERLARGDVLR